MCGRLGSHIAMVLQEPYLFTGSVMENIRYASHWASDEAVAPRDFSVVHFTDFRRRLISAFRIR